MGDIVEIIDVTPRDGIQNEEKILSTEIKLALIDRALAAGIRRLEVTSFVNPQRVPQMADAEAVVKALPPVLDARYIGLTLNQKGFDRAVAAGLKEANFVVVASDSFNLRNQGVTTAQSIAAFSEIRARAPASVDVGVTIAAAFGCPFEGEVPMARLLRVVDACMAADPAELTLADTIGVATPRDVTARLRAIRTEFPKVPLRLHLHNTRNTGMANAWAGLEAGVRRLDASFGGVGGCPFAPRATGNIPLEDLVYMLERSGVQTNVALDEAISTAEWLEAQLEKPLPGMVMKAGGFPTGSLPT